MEHVWETGIPECILFVQKDDWPNHKHQANHNNVMIHNKSTTIYLEMYGWWRPKLSQLFLHSMSDSCIMSKCFMYIHYAYIMVFLITLLVTTYFTCLGSVFSQSIRTYTCDAICYPGYIYLPLCVCWYGTHSYVWDTTSHPIIHMIGSYKCVFAFPWVALNYNSLYLMLTVKKTSIIALLTQK